MYLFWCISITNNVESCKKINGSVQTFRFSVFTMGRQELCAENAKKTPKLGKLKRKILQFSKTYGPYRMVPWESWRPEDSKNVVVFEFSRFQTIVIGRKSWVKIEEKILRRGGVKKKRHGHNIQFWALIRNQRGPNMVGSTLIPWQSSKLKIVAVSFFCNASYFRWRTSFFGLVHLWRPITPVQKLPRPISSTFSETSGREVSHGPSPDIFFFEQISRNERFMKKIDF